MKKLVRLIDEKIVREGSRGRSTLALAIGRGERMVERFRKGESIPSPDQILQLALACGCSEEEALQLARGASVKAHQRTG